jgi:tripartite-type tricarboxylate transporter receptor subunit TctC
LAVTSTQRSPYLPDVPTMQESGIPGYEMSTWIGVSTVARTPPAILARMYEVTRAMMDDDATRQRFVQTGFDLVTLTPPDEMVALHRAEFERWGPVLQAAGARVN